MSDTVTIPHLAVGDLGWQLMRLGEPEYTEKRDALVDRLYAEHGVDPAPPAWSEAPLTRWCWLILVVNDLERDPEVHHPLIHWGIDMGFVSTTVREFIWAIS